LEETSKIKYQARLAERGLKAQGAPDKGGAFELSRHTLIGTSGTVSWPTGSATNVFTTVLPRSADNLNAVHAGGLFIPAPYRETGLDAYAQQAYARTAPTSVVFDAGQFLGELREGLPRLGLESVKSGLKFYKGLGSDYLNVEFGWKPFVTDIVNATKALLQATEELSQQGQRVHRRHSAPLVTQADYRTFSRAHTFGSGGPGLLSPAALSAAGITSQLVQSGGDGLATAEYTKTRSVKRWFEGEFTSFFPLGFNPDDFFHRAQQLIKLQLDPKTLWELSPWSWLVDWQLRIGDTIAANQYAANDLLIMHYGYAMETAVYTTECSWRTTSPSGYFGYPSKGRHLATTVYKRRLRANPYGFRVGTSGGLTDSQLLILGALGLTKAK